MSRKIKTYTKEKDSRTRRLRKSEVQTEKGLAQQASPSQLLMQAFNVPSTLTPSDILALQQTAGNRAVEGILRHIPTRPSAPANVVQRKTEKDTLQEKSEPAREEENRTGLPDSLKAGIENLSGLSLDDVKVHYNSSKPAEVRALAFTRNTDIYLRPNEEKQLPHEAWHVVQQKQGRVKPILQAKGVVINDDAGLEKEADLMGAKASQTGGPDFQEMCGSSCSLDDNSSPHQRPDARPSALASKAVVQRKVYRPEEWKKEGKDKFNPRHQVKAEAELNGHDLGVFVSQTDTYLREYKERTHAEDEVIDDLEAMVFATELRNPKIYDGPAENLEKLKLKNKLEISGLSASPCSSEGGTSNKSEGCTERLIKLQKEGLDLKMPGQSSPTKLEFGITVEADHYYQPGKGGSRRKSRAASEKAAERMKAAGITVRIGDD